MSSNAQTISTINEVILQLNRYLSLTFLLFGIIGNLLNCLTLSQRNLRSNPCAFLFLISSISNLITLLAGVIVRLLGTWSINASDSIDWLCKLRIFVLYWSRSTATWLITLATIERWLLSCIKVHYRQMSSLKNAQRAVVFIICSMAIIHAELFYCEQGNVPNTASKCYGITLWCRVLVAMQFAFINVLIPALVMFIFGIVTVFNIRTSAQHRIHPTTHIYSLEKTHNARLSLHRIKRTDHSLLKMLTVQVILLTIFSLPQAIHNIYINVISIPINSSLTIAINNLIANIAFSLSYLTNGIPFYIYTLAGGNLFRKCLLDGLKHFLRKIICK